MDWRGFLSNHDHRGVAVASVNYQMVLMVREKTITATDFVGTQIKSKHLTLSEETRKSLEHHAEEP